MNMINGVFIMKRLYLLFLSTALLIVGCTSKTVNMDISNTHHDFFSYNSVPDKGYQAMPAIGGTLVKNNLCILFIGEDGITYTPVFPFEETKYDKENNRIILGEVPIDFGRHFITAGFKSEWNNELEFATTSDQSCFREKPIILDVGSPSRILCNCRLD